MTAYSLSTSAPLRVQRLDRSEYVVYSVFGDESSDDSKSRVFAVAGVFGGEEDWKDLTEAWSERTGGVIFHASDCETDQGDFANREHSENQALYKDLTQLLCRSRLMGRAHAMDVAAWRSHFPLVPEDVPYLTCFRNVIHRCGDLAQLAIPQDKVEFTFDQRVETNYNAGVLYSYMARLKEWSGSAYLHDKVSFASRKYVGIQVADLVAREAMKHLDNMIGPVKRPIRRSMLAITGTYRFEFTFHMKEYFDGMKTQMPALREGVGLDVAEYAGWLADHGLVDNISNRHRHMMEKFPPEATNPMELIDWSK